MEQNDPCPMERCAGSIGVLDSDVTEDGRHRVRYLGCRVCGFRPENNKRIIPIEHAPGRQSQQQRRLSFQRLSMRVSRDD